MWAAGVASTCQDLDRWIKVPGPYSDMEPSQEALYRTARFLCAGEATECDAKGDDGLRSWALAALAGPSMWCTRADGMMSTAASASHQVSVPCVPRAASRNGRCRCGTRRLQRPQRATPSWRSSRQVRGPGAVVSAEVCRVTCGRRLPPWAAWGHVAWYGTRKGREGLAV